MKYDWTTKLFVFLVLVLLGTIIVKQPTISGKVVSETNFPLDKRGEFDSRTYYFDIAGDFNFEAGNLKQGNTLYAIREDNKYSLVVLRVYENYELGDAHLTLLVSPGHKRITLGKGQSALVDFDNDRIPDVRLRVISIAGESASLLATRP